MMKSTGVVRQIDPLGRIVLPISLRRSLDINSNDSLEMYVDGSNIILEKYAPRCVFCGDKTDLAEFKGELICSKCMEELKNN